MANISKDVTELIGGTPLMALDRFAAACGLVDAHLIGKMEMLNPAGSAKDRVALKMIEDAETDGRLRPSMSASMRMSFMTAEHNHCPGRHRPRISASMRL